MNAVREVDKSGYKVAFDALKDTHQSYKRRTEAQFDAYEQEIAELRKQLDQERKEKELLTKKDAEKSARIDNLFMELNWIRKVHYNPSFRPVEKDVIITAHDHARKGEPSRLFVGTKAQQTGMARNTYGSTLQKLNDFGVLKWEVGEGQKTEKGFAKEGLLTFPEQLLKSPDEIVIDRGPENRGGNAKEKAAKKACPNCNSIQLEEGKVCYCKNCSHQWEEGHRKDVNDITPQDEIRESANVKPQTPEQPRKEKKESKVALKATIPQEPEWLKQEMDQPTDEELQQLDTLFPEEETKVAIMANIDENKPPQPICPKCAAPKDSWEDTFDYWYCSTCVGGV